MCALAALMLSLFTPAVFGGQALFVRDISMVWYPQVETFVRCVASGSWPLWDVYRGFGQPLLADPSAQVLYPLTWLNLVIRPWHYYTIFAAFHLVVTACGMYLLLQRWGCSRAASFVGSATWGLSGPLLSLVSLYHHFASAAWIPWVFLAAVAAFSSGTATRALGWGIAMAIQILAGSADMVAITGLAVLAYAGAHHVQWRSPWGPANKRLVLSAILATLVALGLSAALWVPTLTLAAQSPRMHLALSDRATWSLHPLGLLSLVCPARWSSLPALFSDFATSKDLQAPLLYSIYLGGPLTALALSSLATRGLPRKRFFAFLALGALVMALGRYSVGYDAAIALLPPLRILRFPVKWIILVAFGWSILAGMGYEVWRRPQERTDRSWSLGVVAPLALLAILLLGSGLLLLKQPALAPLAKDLVSSSGLFGASAVLALARRRMGHAAPRLALALAALSIGELAIRQRDVQAFAPRQIFTHRPEVLDVLDTNGHGRLYVYDYSVVAYAGQDAGRNGWGYRLARAPEGFSRPAAQILGAQMYLNPPTAGRWGLFGSYDLDLLGLAPERVSKLNEYLRRSEGGPTHLRLLRLAGVGYALALHRERWWDDLVPVATLPGLFVEPIQVLRVPDPLPRSYVVGGARIADDEHAYSVLEDPSFDPSRELILPSGMPQPSMASFRGSSRITRLEPDRIELEAELNQAGYLVLLDGYDGGWRARVDGREATLLRANIAFRAVAVPPGPHRVELFYRPSSVIHGALASALTTVVLGGVALSRRLLGAA